MKIKRFSKITACVLSALMVLSSAAVAVSATTDYKSETHDVFKHTESTLAPGIEQSINYAYAKDGKQMVYYVTTADVNRDDVVVQTSYLKQHENGVMGMEKLTNQIAYANAKYSNPEDDKFISEYYNVVAGVNASFYNMTTGQPMGITYIDGVSFGTSNYDNFFAILNDGKTAVIDYAKNLGNYVDAEGNSTIWQAAGGSQWLVRDGADVTASATGSYNTDRHSRTCVGVTAEGKVVMMVLDGRQEPFSCGGSMHELAQIMLEQGCVAAINLDGGGSTTYAARQAGTDSVKVINRPSDGSERSISSGLIIASTAAPSNVFDRVNMVVEDDYVAPGVSTNVTVSGVSPAGTAAEIPDEVIYSATYGTYADGVYTAGTTEGQDTIVATLDGKVVGSVDVNIVTPDAIKFDQAEMVVPFGKTVEVGVTATTNDGMNAVKINENNIEFSFDNEIGTMNGFNFTASTDETKTSAVCTVTIKGTSVSATASFTLGKGSEVIADFNDGNVGSWKTEPLLNYNYYFPGNNVSVKNNALRVELDYSNSFESGYMCTGLGTSETYVIENGLALGFKIFVPEEAEGLRLRMCFYDENNTRKTAEMLPIGKVSTLEKGAWYYVKADISKYPTAKILAGKVWLEFYVCDRDDIANYGYNHLDYDSLNTKLVFYIDDITVDYSSAVDDREAPVFNSVSYAFDGAADALTLANGTVIKQSDIEFTANVSDYESNNAVGVDATSAKAYIDGNEVPTTYVNGFIKVNSVYALSDGKHHIKFEIADKNGNVALATRSFTINNGSKSESLKLVAHDESLENVLFGSLYYVDLVATDIEKVQSATVDLDLNNMNKWQLDHMVVTNGFEAGYEISEDNNVATITVTRTGNVELTGEAALLSMPIRVFEMPIKPSDSVGATSPVGSVFTYASFKKVGSKGESWPVSVNVEVDKGLVTYTDDTTDFFSGEDVKTMTESQWWHNDSTTGDDYLQWNGGHDHRAETKEYYASNLTNHVDAVALEDKAATCTEAGYTGRTFCEVCNSVVDWGTMIPATGHTYETIDGVLKCKDCGELFNGESDGKLYVDGVLANGWVDESYYVDGERVTGIKEIEGYFYDFSDDGVCVGKYTGPIEDEIGLRYIVNGKGIVGWWEFGPENNEHIYYFGKNVNGVYYAVKGKIKLGSPLITYTFDDDCHLIAGDWYKTDSGTRYYWAGKIAKKFLTVGDKTYYFDNTTGYLQYGIKGISLTHGDKPTYYYFDYKTGELIDTFSGDGLRVYDEEVVFLKDGEPIEAGLVKDNDGNYYYINSSKTAVKNCEYAFSEKKANGLLPAGKYTFAADGKLVIKQGVVRDSDGEVRYYIDNVAVAAGLVQDREGNYYYINSTKKAVKNCVYAFSEKNANGLLPAGKYTFAADGKMVYKQGVVLDSDGEVRYYIDNVAVAAGLVQDREGNYYYINSTKKAVKNCVYAFSEKNANGLLPAGKYTFAADGKMVYKQGVVLDSDGEVRYYIDNVAVAAGLVQDREGNYYYINSTKKAVKNCWYAFSASKANGLLPAGKYAFDADGRLILK